jgi:hypothetical protein
MNSNIENEINDLKSALNILVKKEISLTDEKVVKLSVKLDKLLNIFITNKS